MKSRTVVAWDGTPESQVALEWAVAREVPVGGTVNIVRIVDDSRVDADYVVTENVLSQTRRDVDREAERLSVTYPMLTVNTHVVQGDPCEEILRFANPNTVVALGTESRHGHRFKYRWSLGARLAALSADAIAIIPSLEPTDRRGVVTGIDGSELSMRAAHVAAAEAERTGQPLTVLHAWNDPMVAGDYRPNDDFIRTLQHQHQLILNEAVELIKHAHHGVDVTSVLVRDQPAAALSKAAETTSLLVIGNHRVHGIDRLLLGSVSHEVILRVDAPTLVVGSGVAVESGWRAEPRQAESLTS